MTDYFRASWLAGEKPTTPPFMSPVPPVREMDPEELAELLALGVDQPPRRFSCSVGERAISTEITPGDQSQNSEA